MWPILATRGQYKDQFIYLIIGTNCIYSLIYILVPIETSSGQDDPKTPSRSNRPAASSILDPYNGPYFTLSLHFISWPKSDQPTLTFLRKIAQTCRPGGRPKFSKFSKNSKKNSKNFFFIFTKKII